MKTLRLFISPVVIMATAFLILSLKAPDTGKETERVKKSADVLNSFGKMKESIPHQLIADYQGIVIIPNLINAGFGIGGKRGKGVAMVKLPDGKWSDPVFITLTGGTLGLQIGVQSVDMVLVFRHKGVLAKVKNGDFTIGGDISAAAGPVGRSSTASTDYKLEAEVYSYSRSRGLFAGITIHGSNLSIDKSANNTFYSNNMSSAEIFETGKSARAEVAGLKTTLSAL
jgi:lipid-binding SYLF domain-containing protein